MRVTAVAKPVLAGVLATYAMGLLVWSSVTLQAGGLRTLGDFGSFYASGQAAGRGLDPYDVYPLTMDAALGRGTGAAINLNAPTSLLVFQPLSLFDPAQARLFWFAATLVAYGVMLGLLIWQYPTLRKPLALAWALAITALLETVELGQVYTCLALLACAGTLLLSRGRGIAGGALVGFVVAFKPNFLVWPVMLWLGGHRREAVLTGLWAAVFSAIPALTYGPGVYGQWLATLRLEGMNSQVANASLPGMLVRDGLPDAPSVLVGAALIGGVAVWIWRARPSITSCSGAALASLLLGSPLAWVGYSLFLLPSVARLGFGRAMLVAALLLCIPRLPLQGLSDASGVARITLGAAFSVAWLLILGRELAQKSVRD
jgi:hypothetical protein